MSEPYEKALSMRARQAVKGLIEGLAPGEEEGDKLAPALLLLSNLDDEIPQVLEAVMKHGGLRARVVAALMFYKGVENFPHIADDHPAVLTLAENIVVSCLNAPPEPDAHHATCEFMGRVGAVPDSTHDSLERLMAADDLTAAYAATALSWLVNKESHYLAQQAGFRAQQRLSELLGSENHRAIYIAAPTLLLRDVQFDRAMNILLQILPKLDWREKCGLSRFMEAIGPRAKCMLPMLKDILKDKTIPSFHRARAAAAIGSVSKGDRTHAELLSMYLLSTDYQLLNGAANGLFMNGHASEKDIHQLAEHLESEDKQLRQAALTSLQRFGPAARPALAKLLERFGSESDPQIVLALTDAIGAIGMDAIDPLIEEGKRLDFRTMPLVAAALKAVGDIAVEPLAEKLLGDPDEHVRAFGALVMQGLGSKAAAAVPALIELLRDTRDIDIAHTIIGTFAVCGPSAAAASEVIIDTMVSCDDPAIEDIAIVALQRIGAPALPALEKALKRVTGPERERLERAMTICRLRATQSGKFKHFEQLDCDYLFRYFVLVGLALRMLIKANWENVGSIIKAYVTFKRPNGRALGTSPNAVSAIVEELAKKLSIQALTTHKQREAGRLTKDGERILDDAIEYVRGKYGHDAVPNIKD